MPANVIHGDSPLVLVLPYVGTNLSPVVYKRLTDTGRALPDTDYHLDRLIGGLAESPTIVRANFSRVLSDVELNHSSTEKPSNRADYIAVIPLHDRSGDALWAKRPSVEEATHWRSAFYAPFHAALHAQIARVRARHGHAVVAVVHTLRDDDDMDGFDIAISTDLASREAVYISTSLTRILDSATDFRCYTKGKTTARWLTRLYCSPERATYALQLSIRPSCFTTTSGEPNQYDEKKAKPLREIIEHVFRLLSDFRPH